MDCHNDEVTGGTPRSTEEQHCGAQEGVAPTHPTDNGRLVIQSSDVLPREYLASADEPMESAAGEGGSQFLVGQLRAIDLLMKKVEALERRNLQPNVTVWGSSGTKKRKREDDVVQAYKSDKKTSSPSQEEQEDQGRFAYLKTKPFHTWDEQDRKNYGITKKDRVRLALPNMCYTIVLKDLSQKIQEKSIVSRVYMKDTEDEYKTFDDGEYKTLPAIYSSFITRHKLTATFSTNQGQYQSLTQTEKNRTNMVKKILNMIGCIAFWHSHDGITDLVIMGTMNVHINRMQWIQKYLKSLHKDHQTEYTTEGVEDYETFLYDAKKNKHLRFLGCNNDQFLEVYDSL